MIRRLRHHRMLTLASFCSAYMSSKYVLKSNLEYLLQGILLSASAHSFRFLHESSLVFSVLYKLIVRMRSNVRLTPHTSIFGISTTSHSSCALEKWIPLSAQKNREHEGNIAALRGIIFLSRILQKHLRRCCEGAPLLLLSARSWFRFVKLITKQPDAIRGQSVVALTHLWIKWMAESRFKMYAPAILVDFVTGSRLDTFPHKLNNLLIPCIHCIIASTDDPSTCFFGDELGNVRVMRERALSRITRVNKRRQDTV
jgi:hypothetical protein